MSSPRVIYRQLCGATTETEVSTLANIYRYLLNSASKNAPGVSGTKGDNAKKGSLKHDSRAKRSIP